MVALAKKTIAKAGDTDVGWNPWVRKTPLEGALAIHSSILVQANSMDRGVWPATSPWNPKELTRLTNTLTTSQEKGYPWI